MLEKITIKNINSIDTCEIDFKKGNYKFLEKNINGEYVNPIVIYGHNGSGKSSFMNAIAFFIALFNTPVDLLQPFLVNNFLFEDYKKNKNEDLIKGSINLFFEIDNDKYEYFLETSRLGYISSEYLKVNNKAYLENKKRKYTYLARNYTKNTENSSPLIPLLRILSSQEINDSVIQKVSSYIRSFVEVNVNFINRGAFVASNIFNNTNLIDLLVSKSNDVKKLLENYSNFPVYSIVKDNVNKINGLLSPQYSVILEDGDFKRKLPLQMLSTGMQNQSTLLSLILSMPENGVMFIDEADIALHPSIIESFFDVIRSRKIQVVLTLHNTYAMQSLRPDQIYFAKWKKGFSKFYRLSKIYPNIREINNIEKMYLSTLFDEVMDDNE